jgi:hypothetical protein
MVLSGLGVRVGLAAGEPGSLVPRGCGVPRISSPSPPLQSYHQPITALIVPYAISYILR